VGSTIKGYTVSKAVKRNGQSTVLDPDALINAIDCFDFNDCVIVRRPVT
jgi:hypothetical protein